VSRLAESLAKRRDGPEDRVAFHLHRYLAGRDRARSPKVIHASDATREDFCPRRQALLVLTKTPERTQFVHTAQRLVWAQGNAIASQVVRWAVNAGICVGAWHCPDCGFEVEFGRRPPRCSKCGGSRFSYREVRFQSEDCGVSGGMDLLVDLPTRKRYLVVELKTIDKLEFQRLKMPLAEHRQRTQLYLRCIAESDSPHKHLVDQDRARVLYVSKGGYGERSSLPREWGVRDGGWTPFKEYEVRRDDEAVDDLADAARPLHRWLRGQGGLPSGVCPSAVCDRAQRCEVVGPCFSGDYPAGSYRRFAG